MILYFAHWLAKVTGLYRHIWNAILGSLFEPKVTGTGSTPSVRDQHDTDMLTYEWAGYIERRRP